MLYNKSFLCIDCVCYISTRVSIAQIERGLILLGPCLLGECWRALYIISTNQVGNRMKSDDEKSAISNHINFKWGSQQKLKGDMVIHLFDTVCEDTKSWFSCRTLKTWATESPTCVSFVPHKSFLSHLVSHFVDVLITPSSVPLYFNGDFISSPSKNFSTHTFIMCFIPCMVFSKYHW